MSDNIVEAIFQKLGGRSVLRRNVASDVDLARVVGERIPLEALALVHDRAGFSEHEIADYVIPRRTRTHRAARDEPLNVEESDRLVRLVRIQAMAEDVFGDIAKANQWLRRPLRELDGSTPLEVARTEAGARVIETILAKIDWGAAL